MATPDWSDSTLQHRYAYEMIDPMNINESRGMLTGVVPRSSKLDRGYYVDTRVTGSIRIVDSNYIEDSRIRIHHYIDEYEYHNALGTFFVGNDAMDYEQGIWSGTVDLFSPLFGLAEDFWVYNYTIPAGKYTRQAMIDLLKTTNRDYIMDANVGDYPYNSGVCYEKDTNILSTLFDISAKSNDGTQNARLDVDGYGNVTIKKYVNPKNLETMWEWDFDSPQSTIVGPITYTKNRLDVPGRVAVFYKNGDFELTGVANAPSTSFAYSMRRGYMKAVNYNISEMSPETQAQVQMLAENRLKSDSEIIEEYEFKCLYCPALPGDGATLTIGGVTRKGFVKNVTNDFGPGMGMSVLFKVA